MVRILFWSAAFWPGIGGVQSVGRRLALALRDRSHRIHVIADQHAAELPLLEYFDGIPVSRLPLAWRRRQGLDPIADVCHRVRKIKLAFKPDIVHSNGVSDSDFFHHVTAAADSTPWLVTLHGLWPEERETLVRRTLECADWVTGCSAAILEEGRRLVPAIRERSSIVHAGVEPPPCSPQPLPFNPPRVLYLGRLSPEKGVGLAVDAFAGVARRDSTVELWIAGDGPERTELQQRATRLGVEGRIRFLGWVAPTEVPAIINQTTLVLVPSREEAFGQAALEAAIMGRPVVASATGGLVEIVRNQETGLLLTSRRIEEWEDAIARLLACPKAAVTMGQRAQREARTRFDWKTTVDSIEALYGRLAPQAAPTGRGRGV